MSEIEANELFQTSQLPRESFEQEDVSNQTFKKNTAFK